MERITLRNSFHNTEATVVAEAIVSPNLVEIKLSPSQERRAWRKLCGIHECTCCNAIGIRGKQSHDGKPLIVIPSWA